MLASTWLWVFALVLAIGVLALGVLFMRNRRLFYSVLVSLGLLLGGPLLIDIWNARAVLERKDKLIHAIEAGQSIDDVIKRLSENKLALYVKDWRVEQGILLIRLDSPFSVYALSRYGQDAWYARYDGVGPLR